MAIERPRRLDPRAKVVSKRLSDLNLSNRWLATRIGASHQAIAKWLSGESFPRDPAAWDRALTVLEIEEQQRTKTAAATGSKPLLKVRPVPLVPIKVIGTAQAGFGDGADDLDSEIWIPMGFASEDDRATIVEGESLLPFVEDGDIAIIRPAKERRPGVITAIRLSPTEVVLKSLTWSSGQWTMSALNPAFETVALPAHHEVLGYLVGVYRDRYGEQMFRYSGEGLRFLT